MKKNSGNFLERSPWGEWGHFVGGFTKTRHGSKTQLMPAPISSHCFTTDCSEMERTLEPVEMGNGKMLNSSTWSYHFSLWFCFWLHLWLMCPTLHTGFAVMLFLPVWCVVASCFIFSCFSHRLTDSTLQSDRSSPASVLELTNLITPSKKRLVQNETRRVSLVVILKEAVTKKAKQPKLTTKLTTNQTKH